MKQEKEFFQTKPNPEQMVREILKQRQIDRSSEYDAEFFFEAVKQLTAEFREADLPEQRKILLSRFTDAFFPDKQTPKTKLFEEFAFRPIPDWLIRNLDRNITFQPSSTGLRQYILFLRAPP